MRSISASMLIVAALAGAAFAQPLRPMEKGFFDGIPLDQAMSTLHVLGKWMLPRDGSIQVFTMAGIRQKGCIGADSDPEQCSTSRLYVAAEDSVIETHGMSTKFYPATHFLLRGTNGTGWFLPEKGTLKFDTSDNFSLLVCGSQFTTHLSGGAIVPTAYTLHIIRKVGKDKQPYFTATMKALESRLWPKGCGGGEMFGRDENFRTDPSSIKPGKAPR